MRLAALGILVLSLGACSTLTSTVSPFKPSVLTVAVKYQIEHLVEDFGGKVGVAVEDLNSGKVISVDGRTLYPQQSVSKLWVALTVLDEVDRGRLSLEEPITVGRADMSVFNQPIQQKLGETGFDTTLGDLMGWCVSKSDNAATDILIRRAGGPSVIAETLAARGLKGLRASPEEHLLESRIAGLDWSPSYSFGQAFWIARDQVPMAKRQALLDGYVADPEDGATPIGVVHALGRLQKGELLSASSTAIFMGLLTATETGPLRLKAGLSPGWRIAHKTGTGQDLGELSTGYNDVGLITAPNGDTFAIAVMIAATRRPIPERQALMAAVSRTIVTAHDEATLFSPAAEPSASPTPP